MKIPGHHPVFTNEFFNSEQISTLKSSDKSAAQKEALISYNDLAHASEDELKADMAKFTGDKKQFALFEKQYKSLLDGILNFQKKNRNMIKPGLLDSTLETAKEHIETCKSKFFDDNGERLGNDMHKAKAYGTVKRLLHEYMPMLEDENTPIQKRLDTIPDVCEGLSKCTYGMDHEVSHAIRLLSEPGSNIKAIALWQRESMVTSIINKFIPRHHAAYLSQHPGNEKHFYPPYFNHMTKFLKMQERKDDMMSIVSPHITPELLEKCKEEVFRQMKPELLFRGMTKTYLGKIRDHVEKSPLESSTAEGEPKSKRRKIEQDQIDLSRPIPSEQTATVFQKIEKFTKGALAKDFGDVPVEHYLEQNDEGLFQFRESSSVIDQKFGAELRKRELVNYDDVISIGKIGTGDLMQLGNLFWVRHMGVGKDEGEREARSYCEELSIKDLLTTSPNQIYNDLVGGKGMKPDDACSRLESVLQHVMDSAAAEGIKTLPDAWLGEFVSVYKAQANATGVKSIDKNWIAPALLLAARYNCANTLHSLIEAGIDVSVADTEEGMTATMLAAQNGHTDILKELIAAGANINAENDRGLTATMLAAQNGHTTTLKELISANANIHAKNADDFTAVMIAAQNGHAPALRELITAGANIHVKDDEGFTATMIAAEGGHTDVLKELIAAKADINATNDRGITAAMCAAQKGHTTALTELIKAKANIDATNDQGMTAAMFAASKGHTAALTKLINAGANIDAKNNLEMTAVMCAAEKGHTAALKELIDANAEIYSRNTEGFSAVMIAVLKGHATTVKELLKANNDIHVRTPRGFTLAMLAAQNGHAAALKELIDAKADVHATNDQGATAAMFAAENGYAAVLKELITAKANIDATNDQGFTAAILAAEKGHTDALKELIAANANHSCHT